MEKLTFTASQLKFSFQWFTYCLGMKQFKLVLFICTLKLHQNKFST